jgi:hypothetical protein
MKQYPTQSRLKELLQYDPCTGTLNWIARPSNRVRVGDVAGYADNHGYLRIRIDNVGYYAHRLSFLYMLGEMPDEVDHINHVRDDNRWCNLGAANPAINRKNLTMRTDNSSGITGVSWYPKISKWRSEIKINGKRVHLGYFKDLKKAKAARSKASRHYGFHANHGVDGVLS